MKTVNYANFIMIFAGTNWEAGVVKNLLKNAEINVFINDEHSIKFEPGGSSTSGAGAVKVFVSNADFENASKIVEEFKKNRLENGE